MTQAELERQQTGTLVVGGILLGVVVVLGMAGNKKPRKNPRRRRRGRRKNPGRCPIDEATSMGTTGGVTMGCPPLRT